MAHARLLRVGLAQDKAIYERYMGWFDGNPAHLWQHPPAEEATRYVACMGGIDATVDKARHYAADGDLRFAATLLDHAVFADPEHSHGATTALADVFDKLGFGAENGTWRNFYLTGARELRTGITPNPTSIAGGMAAGLSNEQVRLPGHPRRRAQGAGRTPAPALGLHRHRRPPPHTLSNGALIHRPRTDDTTADATLTLTAEMQGPPLRVADLCGHALDRPTQRAGHLDGGLPGGRGRLRPTSAGMITNRASDAKDAVRFRLL